MSIVPGLDFAPSIAMCTPIHFIPGEDGRGERTEPCTIQWHRAVKMLMLPLGYNVGEVRIDGYEVAEARNKAVRECLDHQQKYLFFLDSDTIPPQNGFAQLVYQLDNNPDYDIAAGLYTPKATPPVPLIWNSWGGRGVYWDWTLGDVLKDGILGCPMGCTLIRLSLFDRLPEKDGWFKTIAQPLEEETGLAFMGLVTEDLYFCKRAIEEANAKILIDTNVYCQHIDWRSGRIYQLAEDCLPLRRLAEKRKEAAA